ncbi:MAG: transposase, partial [Halobacteriovoraceae bacterium]|nr:transposase [Halobacteriovoraceae bacterium]
MESKTYKYYCGLDIHKESYVGCILDKEDVEIRSHKFPAKKDALVSFLSGISDSECLVIVENCNLWRIAYTMLKNLGFCTFLVPASSARKETGLKKTDYYDAKALAELTRINHLKPLYIPKDIILSYRDLTHHLLRLRRTKVQYMNRIKAELLRSGINYPPKIWNKKGIFWLQSLANVQIKSLINLLLTIKSEEKKIEKEVEKIADSLETTKILQTIPGVGKFLSLLIYAETGE